MPSRPLSVDAELSSREQLSRRLRISLVQHCNFACFFCHNEGQRSARPIRAMTVDELELLCRAAIDAGVSEIKLTGGEPLLYRDRGRGIVDLVRRLDRAREGRCVGISMTTNGLLLGRFSAGLAAAGLDRVTVSLHTLDPETLRATADRRGGGETIARVVRGIAAARDAGLEPLKLNTVLFGGAASDAGNVGELPRLIAFARAAGVQQLKLYTLLPSPALTDAEFERRYRFWDDELLTTLAQALTDRRAEAEQLVAQASAFVREWAPRLYPKPTLHIRSGDLTVDLEAMSHGRFADGTPDEGAYSLRLGAAGELTGQLGAGTAMPLLDQLRGGAGHDDLVAAFRTARRTLLPSDRSRRG